MEQQTFDLLMNSEFYNAMVAVRAAQGEALGLIVTLNFAMYAAIYYFLNGARFALKLMAFVLYTLGFITFAGLLHLHTDILVGMRRDMAAIYEQMEHQSFTAQAWVMQQHELATMIIDAAVIGGSVLLWLGGLYLLFLTKLQKQNEGD